MHQNKITKCQLLKNLFLSLMKQLYYGPFIFYQVGGGGYEKKMVLKRGQKKNNGL